MSGVRPDLETELREHRRDALVEVGRSAGEPVVEGDGIRLVGRGVVAAEGSRGLLHGASWRPWRRCGGRCGRRRSRRAPARAPAAATRRTRRTGAVVTVPASGTSSPASRRSSVDLPAPLAPTTPTTSPGATVRSRCSKRVRWAWPPARSLATRVALTPHSLGPRGRCPVHSRWTVTTSPSMSWSTASGTSMRQFAAASAVRCRASGARHGPVVVEHAREELDASGARVPGPAAVCRLPGSRRRHPVASVEGGTHEDVEGDEGADRRARQADDGRGAEAAEPLRPAGLHRQVHEVEGRQR